MFLGPYEKSSLDKSCSDGMSPSGVRYDNKV
jgi:hypothetical protein